MKPILTIFAAMLAITAWSQGSKNDAITSGKITYEEKIRLQIKLEGDAAQLAANLPKERTSEKILLFTPEATLFEDGVSTGEEMETEHGEGVRIRMVMSGESKVYTDLKNGVVTDQRDFMNRIFLVEKEMPAANWKITGNQKTILGYPCMEAVRQDTSGKKTIVWFTPSITPKGGPAGFCNLPGMILGADIDEGTRTYIAKAVEPVPVSMMKIQKPKDGKKVTEEEYKQIVAEKMKEMGMEQGPGPGAGSHVQIMIRKQ